MQVSNTHTSLATAKVSRPANSVGIVAKQFAHFKQPLSLEWGGVLEQFTLAYETYGTLNSDRSNAILICHALSGDSHVAGYYTADPHEKPGWWDEAVGPGKMFDTDRFFMICSNVIGGCQGSTGPSSLAPDGLPYGSRFPLITVADMVYAQQYLIDSLGIDQLFAVAGGSMGGMQALQWAVAYPNQVRNVIFLASTPRSSAQNIAFNEAGRRAILADPNWRGGDYYGFPLPTAGLAVARMIGHLTYMCDESLDEKFGRGRELPTHKFAPEFTVESYLDHQGQKFVDRFDANTYLYVTKALDYFDLSEQYGSLEAALDHTRSAFLVVSFSSDWLYPSSYSAEMVQTLQSLIREVAHHQVQASFGHDSFLVEVERMTELVGGFLETQWQQRLSLAPAQLLSS
jgi:homoserine O-acetyltransferase/O-succinyltransferase